MRTLILFLTVLAAGAAGLMFSGCDAGAVLEDGDRWRWATIDTATHREAPLEGTPHDLALQPPLMQLTLEGGTAVAPAGGFQVKPWIQVAGTWRELDPLAPVVTLERGDVLERDNVAGLGVYLQIVQVAGDGTVDVGLAQ